MSEMVAIVGNSGTGKTTSLRNLNPETTFIISVTGKSLPFPKAKKNYVAIQKDEKQKKYIGNYFVSSDSEKICNVLKDELPIFDKKSSLSVDYVDARIKDRVYYRMK